MLPSRNCIKELHMKGRSSLKAKHQKVTRARPEGYEEGKSALCISNEALHPSKMVVEQVLRVTSAQHLRWMQAHQLGLAQGSRPC